MPTVPHSLGLSMVTATAVAGDGKCIAYQELAGPNLIRLQEKADD